MRTLCDVCESAAALLFCAADEAALCLPCDHKVHMCNKLASRHVRVGLDNPVDVPRCDICENSPGDKQSGPQGDAAATHSAGENSHSTKRMVEDGNDEDDDRTRHKMESGMIDLNRKPHRLHGQASNNQPE